MQGYIGLYGQVSRPGRHYKWMVNGDPKEDPDLREAACRLLFSCEVALTRIKESQGFHLLAEAILLCGIVLCMRNSAPATSAQNAHVVIGNSFAIFVQFLHHRQQISQLPQERQASLGELSRAQCARGCPGCECTESRWEFFIFSFEP